MGISAFVSSVLCFFWPAGPAIAELVCAHQDLPICVTAAKTGMLRISNVGKFTETIFGLQPEL